MTQSGLPRDEEPDRSSGGRDSTPSRTGVPLPPVGSQPPSWQQSLTSTAPVAGPAGLFYADVPNRIIAYIIDIIVLALIGFVVTLILGGLFGGITTTAGAIGAEPGELNLAAFLVVTITQLAISFAYFGYFWSVQRATPGMRVLALQIGDEADGHSIDWSQAFIRWLIVGIPSILATFASYMSAGLGFLLSIVGLVWLIVLLYTIAQSPTKQGLHDRYAHTIMVKSGRRAT